MLDREQERERKRLWRAKNLDRWREYLYQWRIQNRKKYLKYQREYLRKWRAAHPERALEIGRKANKKFREKMKYA